MDLPLPALIEKERWRDGSNCKNAQNAKERQKTSGELRIAIKVTYERVNISMTIMRGKDLLDMDQSMFVKSATDASDPSAVSHALLRGKENDESLGTYRGTGRQDESSMES